MTSSLFQLPAELVATLVRAWPHPPGRGLPRSDERSHGAWLLPAERRQSSSGFAWALLLAVLCCLPLFAAQNDVVDQQCWFSEWDGAWLVGPHSPIAQEFVPTRPLLTAVTLGRAGGGDRPPFTIRIRRDSLTGPILEGSTVTSVPPDGPPEGLLTPMRFAFSPPLVLEVGRVYLIEVLPVQWGLPGSSINAYPSGRGFLLGNPSAWLDWMFKTHTDSALLASAQTQEPKDDSWLAAMANRFCSRSGSGSPVFVKSGNYRQTVTDAVLPGRGLPLQLTRTYNAKDDYGGPFSRGWNFNQTIQLTRTANASGQELAVVRWADGVRKDFVLNGTTYQPPTGCYDQFEANAEGFRLTTPSGMKLQFNPAGFLAWQEDRNGNRVTYQLDLQNRLVRATSADGRTLDFTYDPLRNRVNGVTDWSGRIWQYEYDASDNLVAVEFPDGSRHTLEYDAQRMLVAVRDALGHRVQAAGYDAETQRATSYAENLLDYSLTYTPSQQTTTKQDSLGRSWTFRYNAQGNKENIVNPAGKQTQMQWTPQQDLAAQIDPLGRLRRYTYDGRGNVLSAEDALGHFTYYAYEPVFNQVTSATDALGHVTENRYDSRGNLVWSKDAAGFIREFEYDACGQMTRATDARGNATVMTYNAHGELLTVTDPLGRTVSYAYDVRGNRSALTNARGHTWHYTHDVMDRLVTVTDPLGHVTRYDYDANGNRTAVTDARGHTTRFTYDSSGRLTAVTNPLGHTTACEYDLYGNIVRTTDPLGHRTTHAYDVLNRLVSVTDPLGHTTAFAYDDNGNRTGVTDALGHATAYEFDALDRLVATTNPRGAVWRCTYDANHNLLTATDPRANVSQNAYDARNWITDAANALGQAYHYEYDGNGNVVRRTDPNGATLVYHYDAANRLTSIVYPDETTLSFTYDANGNVLSVSNPTETVSHTYDVLDRLTQVQVAGLGKTVGYEYDAAGNRSALIDPDGGRTQYAYDALNRLVSLTAPGGQAWNFAYDAANRLSQMTMPNGITATCQYDAASQLTDLSYRNSANTVLQSFAYTYDAAGNPLHVRREDNKYELYQYDSIQQLTRVDYDAPNDVGPSSDWTQYAYDLAGNRTTLTRPDRVETYAYDAANRLLSVMAPTSTTAFSWDNNGNLLSRNIDGAATTYGWDYDNKLVRIAYPGGAINTFAYYPASSLRHTKIDSTGTRHYLYDGQNELQELDGLNNLLAQYTYSLGIDSLLARTAAGASQYYLRDRLGSVTAIADASQNLLATYRYDVFGAVRHQTGTANNPYLFTARRLDNDSGLYYYRARFMAPDFGRFLSYDDLASRFGYSYVANAPTTTIDPSGLIGLVPSFSPPGTLWFDALAFVKLAVKTLASEYRCVQNEVQADSAPMSLEKRLASVAQMIDNYVTLAKMTGHARDWLAAIDLRTVDASARPLLRPLVSGARSTQVPALSTVGGTTLVWVPLPLLLWSQEIQRQGNVFGISIGPESAQPVMDL